LHSYLRKINKPHLIPKNLKDTGEERKEWGVSKLKRSIKLELFFF
jgi:hypothetical protein